MRAGLYALFQWMETRVERGRYLFNFRTLAASFISLYFCQGVA